MRILSVAATALALGSWPTILAGLCGLGSAQLTSFFAHHKAPTWVKSGIAFVLSSLSGVLINVTVVANATWKDYVSTIATTWVIALFSHFAGLTAIVDNATANVGIGANVQPIVQPVTGAPAADNALSDAEQEAAMSSRGATSGN